MKAFADEKLNLAEKLKLVLGRVENFVGKGENAGFQQFLTMFSKGFYFTVIKVGIVLQNPFLQKHGSYNCEYTHHNILYPLPYNP